MTLQKLQQIFTTASDETLFTFFNIFACSGPKFGVITEDEQNMFITQIYSEVGTSLVGVRENLNYSCDALKATFSYYGDRPSEADADGRCGDHAANQVQIGNKAYADRLGNGSVESGDGYTFRGGSYIQTTGRYNYQVLCDGIKDITGAVMQAEELANNITYTSPSLLAALAFWNENCLDCETFDCTTDKINYYTDSRAQRQKDYEWISSL